MLHSTKNASLGVNIADRNISYGIHVRIGHIRDQISVASRIHGSILISQLQDKVTICAHYQQRTLDTFLIFSHCKGYMPGSQLLALVRASVLYPPTDPIKNFKLIVILDGQSIH